MSDVEIRYANEDLRPGFVLDDVAGADFIHVKVQHATGVPQYVLKNVENFNTYESWPSPDTHLEKVEQHTL
jgi:hypothetical protein